MSIYKFRTITKEYDKYLMFKLRYEVYCLENKWLDSSNYHDGCEIDEYDEVSEYIGAYEGDTLVGSVRLILPKENMLLPIEKNFNIEPNKNYNRLELSRLIVPQNQRGINISSGLFHSVTQWFIHNNYSLAYTIAEDSLLNLMNKSGYNFKRLSEGKFYFGALTFPTFYILTEEEKEKFYQNKQRLQKNFEILI